MQMNKIAHRVVKKIGVRKKENKEEKKTLKQLVFLTRVCRICRCYTKKICIAIVIRYEKKFH